MKEIVVTTTAIVINEETWVAMVPDDFDINDADAVEALFSDGDIEIDLESEDHQNTLERNIESVELTGT